MMKDYGCSQCDQRYTHDEYIQLEKQPLNPEEENPMEGSGYETVCECGAGFHSDKWSLRDTLQTPHGEIEVSTVFLMIAHGLNRDEWYETCLFYEGGSRVVDRYTRQEAAELGHEEYVKRISNGNFELNMDIDGYRVSIEWK